MIDRCQLCRLSSSKQQGNGIPLIDLTDSRLHQLVVEESKCEIISQTQPVVQMKVPRPYAASCGFVKM